MAWLHDPPPRARGGVLREGPAPQRVASYDKNSAPGHQGGGAAGDPVAARPGRKKLHKPPRTVGDGGGGGFRKWMMLFLHGAPNVGDLVILI